MDKRRGRTHESPTDEQRKELLWSSEVSQARRRVLRRMDDADSLLGKRDRLKNLPPLGHHVDCPNPLEKYPFRDQHPRCWAWLLGSLGYWPSDLIRAYGPDLISHPLVLEAIRRLSWIVRNPRHTTYYPEPLEFIREHGFSAMESLPKRTQEAYLRDEEVDSEQSIEARKELKRIFGVLADGPPRPRRHRPLRVLLEHDRRRTERHSEAKVVESMVRDGHGSSVAAIRSDIAKARKNIGRRKYRRHHRGPFRRPEEEN